MLTSKRFRTALLLGSAMIATIATPALADTRKSDPTPAAPATDPTPADVDDSQNGLNEIVVTATKRETNLQKTPIAIAVLDSTALADRHVQSLLDLADGAVPSLRVATFEARQSALTVGIRGIVPFDANQTARDQGVGVYVDGVYLGRQQGLNAALFDVERIEVLRGPQGTLFGRNTEGGALSIVSKAPTGVFGGSVTAGIGNYGSRNAQVHLDLPEVYNIAIKVDGVLQHQDATVTNPLAGQTGWNYYDRKGGRVSALWKPVDGLSVQLTYDNARDENTPFYSQLVNYNPTNLPVGAYSGTTLVCPAGAAKCIAPLSPLVHVSGDHRQSSADIGVPQQPSVDDTHGFSSTIHYTISPAIELRSITAWRGVDTAQWDNSGGAHRTIFAPNANFSRYSLSNLHQRQFSQEFQAVGTVGQLDYVAGLYYFTESAREYAATPTTNKWNATGTAYTINDALTWNPANWSVQRDSHAVSRSYAAFAQGTWTPIEGVHLTAGGRYTKDKRNGALTKVSNVATPWTFTFEKSRFDPMVTLAWDATQGVNLYAKYSTGYRAGGANDRSSTFAAFGPEEVKSYEIGAKTDFLDHRVRLNLAGYIMDRTGTQIDFDNVDTTPFLAGGTTPNPTFGLHTENTANAPGVSKIRGLEAELTARPIDNLTLGASYSYTHTQIPATKNPNPGPTFGQLTQVFVVFTPENAASGYLDYVVPVGGADTKLRFHVDANYASSLYSFQNETTKTDPSFIVNGRIALADLRLNDHAQHLTLSVWSRNLFNETHIYRRSAANAATLGDYANFNPPRTIGAEASIKF